MATIPQIVNAARGIARTLSGYSVQSESITRTPVREQVPDQVGAIAEEQTYDERTDLSLTVISATNARTAPAANSDTIAYGGATYYVDSVEEAGSYNGVLRFNIRAHRYTNAPAAAGN